MDDIDRAQVLEAEHLRHALAARTVRVRRVHAGIDCLGCGEEIPPARRAAVPGCCLCCDCQADAERAMGR